MAKKESIETTAINKPPEKFMNSQTRQRKIAIIIGIVLVISTAACAGEPEEDFLVPQDARAGDLTMESCTLEYNKISVEAECGDLFVPENRGKSDSRLIALPVIRFPALGEAASEPVFLLDGGPGSSNMNKLPPDWMREKYVTVAVGYRGADGSSVLDMPEVNEAMKGIGNDLFSHESLANISAAIALGVERLQAQGVDLEGYTIPEVVADMEAARTGLGYEQINLFSISYGTRVAQIYSYLAPDSLHRSVQNAINPPGRMVWEPEMVDTQMEYVSEQCAKDPVCSTRTDDLAETFRSVMHNMPERWLFLSIDPGKVKTISFIGFDEIGIGAISDTMIAAEQGDPSGLALASLAYDFLIGGDIWGDKLAKGASADMDLARDYSVELDPPDSIMGSPAAFTIWGPAAEVWPVTLIPANLRQPQSTDVETLLVSGSIDFRSPAQYATNELLPYLNNGQQVIMSEHGHNDVFIQGDALEHLILTFYETGVGDDSLIVYHPMDFSPQMNFPQIAKIAVGVLALLLLIAGLLIWFVIRWITRRRALRFKS